MTRYCFALDLKNDPSLIKRYKDYHKNVWPEILESIRNSGIAKMEIYNVHTRLFMIIEVTDGYSIEKKNESDITNPKVVEWEQLMETYQQRLPFAKPDEKWVVMEKIFEL